MHVSKKRDRAMKNLITRFAADERGTTVVEYSLIVSLISVAVIAGAEGIAQAMHQLYGHVTTSLNAAVSLIR